MTDQATIDKILQRKFDCLCTKHLHVQRLEQLNKRNMWVDLLAIAVPFLYFVLRRYAMRTHYEALVEVIWEVLAASLTVLVMIKIVGRWQQRADIHNKLLGENIAVAGQADNLLLIGADQISPDSARLFFSMAERSEVSDREALGTPTQKDRQRAYLEGLKESESVCPKCGSSPWSFEPGSCQMCGNKPNNP
jgi:mobilome CxxCx(11)CxxC protein